MCVCVTSNLSVRKTTLQPFGLYAGLGAIIIMTIIAVIFSIPCSSSRDYRCPHNKAAVSGLTEWKTPSGGTFLWLRILGVKDSEVVIQKSLERGLVVE